MSQSVVPPVMGVLNIAFGGFSFLAGLFNIASLLFLKSMMEGLTKNNPVLEVMNESAVLRVFNPLIAIVAVLASAIQVYGGIGLLRRMAWGRRMTIGVAWYHVFQVVLVVIVFTPCLWIPCYQRAADIADPAMRMGMMFGAIFGPLGALFGLILPGANLFLLNRQNVIASLDGPTPGSYGRAETGNPYQSP